MQRIDNSKISLGYLNQIHEKKNTYIYIYIYVCVSNTFFSTTKVVWWN